MTLNQPTIRISEIFGPTIQGEGALIGEPTVFVRTGGCDYRCTWCDTPFAVDSAYRHDWSEMSTQDIWAEIERLSGGVPLMVTLSGGNPAIQDLGPLIQMGQEKGYRFALETQGSVTQDWFADLDVLSLSPKPPSSEMAYVPGKLAACIAAARDKPKIILKFVVFDEADYQFAREVSAAHPTLPVYLQPGNDKIDGDADAGQLNEKLRWLVDRVHQDKWFTAHVLPQLHVMIWGNKRGV